MRLALILLFAIVCTGASAGTATAPPTATACDNLVTLRRLMMQAPEGGPIPTEFAGCREIASDTIGDVEKRAMIGDAPYECRSIAGGSCLWIKP